MNYLAQLLSQYPQLRPCEQQLHHAYQLWQRCFCGGGKLLLCGNGGSAADCDHIVGELMKGFLTKRPVPSPMREAFLNESGGGFLAEHLQQALPAISLTAHRALNSAFANDIAAELVFAQQVYGYGRQGDLLLALSTSGNSENVVWAVKAARAMGLSTIGISGANGGALKQLCDCTICLPESQTYKIQELTLPVYHALCAQIEYDTFQS